MTPNQRKSAVVAVVAALAAPAEGLRQWAYYDPPGILTVCRGHTGPEVVKNKKYSLQECEQFFTEDMLKAVAIVERCAPGLPVKVHAAFADAVFNMGSTIACNKTKSTAARLLAAKDYEGACNQLPRWDKASVGGIMVSLPGLTTRREREKTVCLEGVVELEGAQNDIHSTNTTPLPTGFYTSQLWV